ncbi:Uncharacterised protein [Acinetobacter baumannii]|nr:Uncharacterised protein [Acinetobacter baumannii]
MQEQVEGAVLEGVRVIAEIAGHRAVGVQVDHDHALAGIRQQAGQGDGRGGLADPSFLIGDCPDFHCSTLPGMGLPGWGRANGQFGPGARTQTMVRALMAKATGN